MNGLTEASLHDKINMTKFRLEHDQKIFTTMNVNSRGGLVC